MTKRKRYRTGFLFPKPTVINGIGSIMNIAGNHYRFHYSSTSAEADFKAIESDWGMIGNDIVDVTKKMTKDYQGIKNDGRQ